MIAQAPISRAAERTQCGGFYSGVQRNVGFYRGEGVALSRLRGQPPDGQCAETVAGDVGISKPGGQVSCQSAAGAALVARFSSAGSAFPAGRPQV